MPRTYRTVVSFGSSLCFGRPIQPYIAIVRHACQTTCESYYIYASIRSITLHERQGAIGITVRRYKDQFMLSVYSNGARRTQIFPTKREAERMAVELRAALLRGTVRISAAGDGLTLGAYAGKLVGGIR